MTAVVTANTLFEAVTDKDGGDGKIDSRKRGSDCACMGECQRRTIGVCCVPVALASVVSWKWCFDGSGGDAHSAEYVPVDRGICRGLRAGPVVKSKAHVHPSADSRVCLRVEPRVPKEKGPRERIFDCVIASHILKRER